MFFSHRRSCCCGDVCVPTRCVYSIDEGTQDCDTCLEGPCTGCEYFYLDCPAGDCESCPPTSSATCSSGSPGFSVGGTLVGTDCVGLTGICDLVTI